jgi:formylglycine-generating enzyme required for sulfatase activity
VGIFHWGTRPLAKDVGNFCDEAFGRKYRNSYDGKWLAIDDGHADTAPVGSYAVDANGLFDFAGNVWEWVDGWYDPPKNSLRIVRGGAFRCGAEKRLLASFRGPDPYNARLDSVGFRILCEKQ